MRATTLLTLGLASLATAAPVEERAAKLPGAFEITNFVFGCTTTCDWSFDVAIKGSAANHPAIDEPVHCSGSLTKQNYKKCGKISATQSISAYIDKSNNQLKLQYEVNNFEGARYDYYGQKHVNAQTSGRPQPDAFNVKESSATGVA